MKQHREYTDTIVEQNDMRVVKRIWHYPGGRRALIDRAVAWRGFTREEAEKMYPEEIDVIGPILGRRGGSA